MFIPAKNEVFGKLARLSATFARLIGDEPESLDPLSVWAN